MLIVKAGFLAYVCQDPDGDVTLIAPGWMRPWLEQKFMDAAIYPHPQKVMKGWITTTLTWAEWRTVQAQLGLGAEGQENRIVNASLLHQLSDWAKE